MTSKISDRRKNARNIAAAEYQKRRVLLLKAAADVFREVGYASASVDDIGQRAQMDRASIYYYFKGKKDLFREMVSDATLENVEMAERIAGSEDGAEQKLRNLICDLFDSYERHYPYLYVFVQEDMSRLSQDTSAWSKRILALNRRFDLAVLSMIEEGIRSGVFVSSGDAKLLAAGVVGMCNWSHRWFEPKSRRKARAIGNVFADMVLGGLMPRAESAR